MLLRGEKRAGPFSKMRRTYTNVHCDVEGLAFHYPAQLSLSVTQLVMKPAERALRRLRMIVLNERVLDSQIGEISFVVRLQEKAPRVLIHYRPQLPHTGKGCLEPLQVNHDLFGAESLPYKPDYPTILPKSTTRLPTQEKSGVVASFVASQLYR